MKIELTMTELLLIVDMIKNGEHNEGDDFYLMQDFLDGSSHHKCNKCETKKVKSTKEK